MSFSQNVVYLLGAGFSAPLGLPVMSNFLFKSKDLYASDPDTYKHFKVVFDTIKELSVVKNYYSADLFNIEEILSLLEMQSAVEGEQFETIFLQYISEVIQACMPNFRKNVDAWASNWEVQLYSELGQDRPYGFFISNLLSICLELKRKPDILVVKPASVAKTKYSVVTLNSADINPTYILIN